MGPATWKKTPIIYAVKLLEDSEVIVFNFDSTKVGKPSLKKQKPKKKKKKILLFQKKFKLTIFHFNYPSYTMAPVHTT